MMRLLGRAGSRRACGGLGPDRPAPGPGSTSSPDGRLGLSGLPVGEIPVNAAPAPAERATDPAVPSNRSCTTLQSREQRIQRRYCLRLSITLCNWLRRGAVGWPPSGRGRRCVSSTARCSRRHGPASVHTVKRRCAVAGDVPNVGGRCRQAQPPVSAYTTAVNTARSSHGAVPPPCGRAAKDGSNGAASSQSSSGTRRFDRSAPTTGIMVNEHQVT